MVKRFVYSNGTIIYRNENKKIHREDGPAIIFPGEEYWYKNGQRHREDGPAIILPNGTEYWYKEGKLHREDGPAVTEPDDGVESWYLYDKLYSFKEWIQLVNLSDEEKMELILRYG